MQACGAVQIMFWSFLALAFGVLGMALLSLASQFKHSKPLLSTICRGAMAYTVVSSVLLLLTKSMLWCSETNMVCACIRHAFLGVQHCILVTAAAVFCRLLIARENQMALMELAQRDSFHSARALTGGDASAGMNLPPNIMVARRTTILLSAIYSMTGGSILAAIVSVFLFLHTSCGSYLLIKVGSACVLVLHAVIIARADSDSADAKKNQNQQGQHKHRHRPKDANGNPIGPPLPGAHAHRRAESFGQDYSGHSVPSRGPEHTLEEYQKEVDRGIRQIIRLLRFLLALLYMIIGLASALYVFISLSSGLDCNDERPMKKVPCVDRTEDVFNTMAFVPVLCLQGACWAIASVQNIAGKVLESASVSQSSQSSIAGSQIEGPPNLLIGEKGQTNPSPSRTPQPLPSRSRNSSVSQSHPRSRGHMRSSSDPMREWSADAIPVPSRLPTSPGAANLIVPVAMHQHRRSISNGHHIPVHVSGTSAVGEGGGGVADSDSTAKRQNGNAVSSEYRSSPSTASRHRSSRSQAITAADMAILREESRALQTIPANVRLPGCPSGGSLSIKEQEDQSKDSVSVRLPAAPPQTVIQSGVIVVHPSPSKQNSTN